MANSDVIVRIKADAQNYDANLAKATKTLDQFKKNNLSLGGIANQATSALTSMATSVLSVTAAIGAAKKVMGDMVRINMQFEQSSSNLAAVLGTSRDQITALTDQAKTLGATTQYTASQILELQANLARLGFNQNEILNSTKSVQAMATAMGADLGEAANLAGSALRGFGLNATEMERVASVLSVGTTKSALSFEKLATALPVVQTAAAKTGFTIEDTVAMLGKLTDNGINAASAATQLRKILNDSTTAGTKLANALGGPVKSFDELVLALDKASRSGQNHADSVALVNSKNATALDILRDMSVQREVDVNGVKKQTSALQDLRESITDCAEGMRGMQDEQLNTLQGSITILNSAWEGLMLTFSESNGTIKTVVDSLTELLGAWTKWRQRNQGGDAAIKSYEMADEKVADYGRKYLEAYQSAGMSDDAIKRGAEIEKAALEQERDDLREVLDLWEKRYKLIKSGQSGLAQGDEFAILREKGLSNTSDVREKLTKQVAQKNSDIAIQNYIISSLTAPGPGKKTESEDGDQEDKSKSRLALLKAQYEAEEKAKIASLDRLKMAEEDYEAEVYKIRRETLQKIADLYQEETAEKARANAAISQLDIQYQGIQMRLANKDNRGSKDNDTFSPSGPDRSPLEKLQNSIRIQQADQASALDSTTLNNLLGVTVKNKISGLDADFSGIMAQMFNGENIPDDVWQELADKINEKLKELNLDPIKLDVKTGGVQDVEKAAKSTEAGWKATADAISTVGGALQQIEDPSAKVAGIIAQAVANIALSFAEAAASPAVTGTGWGWLGFAAAGIATMISTIASIKSVTGGFAQGGIVPGSSYSGDNLTANVNSGELILNRAQQANIAGQLQSNPMGNLRLSTEISGSNLRVVLNNDNRSRGGSRDVYGVR